MSIGHAPNRLIADYSAGALPPGMSLLVASHLTYCPACRDKVARLEALGGALLAEANRSGAFWHRSQTTGLAAVAARASPQLEHRGGVMGAIAAQQAGQTGLSSGASSSA